VRSALKSSVSESLDLGLRPVSNQAEVWDSVARLHAGRTMVSSTGALREAFQRFEDEVGRYRAALGYVPGARGLAVAVEDRVVAIDVFDKPSTCEKVWDRLLSGAVLDALLAPGDRSDVLPVAVETMLDAMAEAIWRPVETVGAGQEYRAVLGRAHASSLAYEGVVLHESLVLA
jgi:hypothetical protein